MSTYPYTQTLWNGSVAVKQKTELNGEEGKKDVH